MICKKCGAYNPDHANFCKVCAASLKDQTDGSEEVKASEAGDVTELESRPRQGNVKAPDFSAARRAATFKAAPKVEAPVVDEDEDDEEEEEEEEEEVKPVRKPFFARAAAPAKKRRVVDEEDEDEDDDEYDEDEDEYDEDDSEAEKLESEPKTSRFSLLSRKKRPAKDEDEDEEDDEDEEEDDEDGEDDEDVEIEKDEASDYDDEDEDDGYEEYEPTPPRRKKASRGQGKGSGNFNIVTLLIICLLAVLLIIVGIVVIGNLKGCNLPPALRFNCSGKAATEPTKQADPTGTQGTESTKPTDAPVTGTTVDYSVAELTEIVDNQGVPSISLKFYARPQDTITIILPNDPDKVVQNTKDEDIYFEAIVAKSYYYPTTVVEDPVYTVKPQILITHADGTQEYLKVDSFDITLTRVQLELTDPDPSSIPEDGVMASKDNTLLIKGKVDDHLVSVTVNGQAVTNMYAGGTFDYLYTMTSDEPVTVVVEASKAAYLSDSLEFTVKPYVFVPEKMPLTVESDITKLKAGKDQKVIVTGTTAPGAILTASAAPEYMTSVICGPVTVDAEGHFSFEVTFKDYYGTATINIHAKKVDYDDGEASCVVSRMYADKTAAIKGYSKTKSYHEVYKGITFEKIMADPTMDGLFRFSGKVIAVDAETGIVTFEAITSAKTKTYIYVLNTIDKWNPAGNINKTFFIYCTLNGLYTDGTSLYATAWFYQKN